MSNIRNFNQSQHEILLSEQTFRQSSINVISICLSLPAFHPDAVSAAARTVLNSADIFRAAIVTDDAGTPAFAPGEGKEPVCGIQKEMTRTEADQYVKEQNETRLAWPDELYDAQVIPLREGGSVLYVRFHHVLVDGYGMSLFAEKVLDALAGKEPEPSAFFADPLVAPDADKHEDEIEREAGHEAGREVRHETGYEDEAFWRTHFKDAQFEPSIFSADVRGLKKTTYKWHIDRELCRRLKAFSKEQGITVPYVLASAYGLYLAGATGKDDAVILMPRLNRKADERNILGCYTLLAPVRVHIDEQETLADLCRRVQDDGRAASAHKAFGYDRIQQILRDEGQASDGLSQYVFNFYRYEIKTDLEYTLDISVAGVMHNHLTWNLFQEGESLLCVFDLRDGIYDEEKARYLSEALLRIISDGMDGRPIAEMEIVGEQEKSRLLSIYGKSFSIDDEATIPSLIRSAAKKYAPKPALYAGEQAYTFEQLDQVTDRIAQALMRRGVKSGDYVAFILKRDIRLIPALLGITKTGAAFIPVDPMYPRDRVEYIIENSGAKYLISSADVDSAAQYEYLDINDLMDDRWDDRQNNKQNNKQANRSDVKQDSITDGSAELPWPHISQSQTAYIIYTSGTTGRPKGVMLNHRGIVNIIHPDNNPFNRDITENGTGIAAIGSICFDISLFEIFVPLFNGLFVELGDEKAMLDAGALAACLRRHGADILHCTPSRLVSYLTNKEFAKAVGQVKAVLSAGEVLPESLASEMKQNYCIRIYNGYGPTETTIGATITEAGDSRTIGGPLANTGILILNNHRKMVPYGAVGEICVYGNGVGIGYKDRPEETADKFILWQGRRVYRTGDLGHLTEDGKIIYHGRNDRQIKLRGLRIELSEIERVMGAYPGVSQSCCVVKKIDRSEHLAGFYTTEKDAAVDAADLKTFMKGRLTPYMVPDILKELDRMPQTPGGKTDLKALLLIPVEVEREYRAPKTETQRKICAAFEAVLRLDQVGLDDNFFELGGDSLSAVELIVELEKNLVPQEAGELDYAGLFKYPTPALLSEMLESEVKEEQGYPLDDLDYSGLDFVLTLDPPITEKTSVPAGKSGTLGNVLLTGVTGYLGIHMFIYLLQNSELCGHIYCLSRPSGRLSPQQRVKGSLFYYAEDDYTEEYGSKWSVVEGDITNPELFKEEFTGHIDTIINAAANVAHFAYGDALERVNVNGVRHLIEYAKVCHASICHVSTISVGGVCEAGGRLHEYGEDDFYVGQKIFNQYIYTKYMAEYYLLRAAADHGLPVRIMRVGNLQGRISDGEFQMNLNSNAFTRRLSSYIKIGKVPQSVYRATVNFSPVDETARMIVKLACGPGRQTVYHVYPPDEVAFAKLFQALKGLGYRTEVVPDDVFEELVQSLKQTDEGREMAEGLLIEKPDVRYADNPLVQKNTNVILERYGERWAEVTDEYLNRYVSVLDGMDLF